MGYGGVGHMATEAHRCMGHIGNRDTGAMPMCPIHLWASEAMCPIGPIAHTPCAPITHVQHTPVPHTPCTLLPHVPHCPYDPSPLSPNG